MDSALESVATSKGVRKAEQVVAQENRRISSEEKKRHLLACGDRSLGRESVGGVLESSSSLGIPAGLSVLTETGHIFIRRAGAEFVDKFFNLPNRFELLNSDGVVTLYAGETREEFGTGNDCFGRGGPTFDVCVMGLNGGGVLNFSGHKLVTTISDFRTIIGTVIDTGTPFAPHERYSVRDWNMVEVFKLRPSPTSDPRDFEVFNKDELKIGKSTTTWSSGVPNHIAVDQLYGISFPEDMDPAEKALLIGSLFAIYFQHLHRDITERNGKWWAYCIFISIIVIFVIAIICVVLWAVLG